MPTLYSLDTSALMNAWNKHYQIDLLPSVWEHVDARLRDGTAVISMQVFEEIERKDDAFKEWTTERKELFTELTEEVIDLQTELINTYPGMLGPGDRNMADPWVIALAQSYNPALKVVTEEGHGKVNFPKIPRVCESEGVEHCTFNSFLRGTGWRERA
jgi:uncharacterized protein DUF4411